uniref:sec1 family domain-containing protein 2-like n=1 Tax=Styela clava TaxID=7725 RepID=UPI001939924A|nr:sec1 family domain-containing protein 2-like [Styela clava]
MNNFFKHTCLTPWKKVALRVQDAVIFMDNPCAECLHWCGGADLLFESGATNIREFSAFESGTEKQEKAVFIISSPLTGKTTYTIENILSASSFNNCLVITTLEPKLHQYASGEENLKEDERTFEDLEHELQKWMGDTNVQTEILHLPIFMAPMFENLFLTPSFDAFFPVQHKDLIELNMEDSGRSTINLKDLHFYMCPREYRTLVRMLTSSLRQCFHSIGCKEEIFALGPTSHLCSVQLSNMVNQQKNTYPGKIGVLFIDRTLDLIGPASHGERCLVDQLLGILPGLPAHCNNVSVDMSILCDACPEDVDDTIVYPGCLVPDTDESPILAEACGVKSVKAVSQIRNQLLKAVTEEGLNEDGDISTNEPNPADNIENLVGAFKRNAGAVLYNSALLQFGLATAQLLKDESCESWETLALTEKLILQQLGDDDVSNILDQITKLAKDDSTTFEELLSLMIYASYAFKSHIDTDVYENLCDSLCEIISNTQCEDLPEHFMTSFKLSEEDLKNKAKLTHAVYRTLNNLEKIVVNDLHLFHILKFGKVEPPSYQPLLSQVIERIFHPLKPDLDPDIEHITTGRKDLLKMGMSMFRKVTPPRPCDFPTLIIYVIGGITATEVSQVNDVLRKFKSNQCEVILGSNRLTSPSDVVDRTLFTDNLNPDFFL